MSNATQRVGELPSGNPIIRHKFTADPTALVHDGVAYLYTGHDEAPQGSHEYVMNDWLCFSSSDLANWHEHPVPLRSKDFGWASGKAYASKVIASEGVFYWIVSVADREGNAAIGVASAASPTGPYRDVIGRPLITRRDLPVSANEKANLDPTAIVADGVPHLIWGNTHCYTARLTRDFTSVAGSIRTIELPNFQEGAHVHERNGWYYLSYGYGMPERVAYAMSRSPAGPWQFVGLLNEVAGNCETNRPCTLEFDGQWYFLYHNGALPGGDSHHRSVCIDRLHYNADATLRPVAMTSAGIYAETRGAVRTRIRARSP